MRGETAARRLTLRHGKDMMAASHPTRTASLRSEDTCLSHKIRLLSTLITMSNSNSRFTARGMNLARRFSVQNENDLLQVRVPWR